MPRALVLAVLVGTIALALALPTPVKRSPPLKKTSKPHGWRYTPSIARYHAVFVCSHSKQNLLSSSQHAQPA
jgi:hypothetical protein